MQVTVKWKLRELLEETMQKPAQVEQAARERLGLSLGQNTIYKLTKSDRVPQRLDMGVVTAIIAALKYLTGRDFTPNDLMEFVVEPDQKAV